MLLSHKRYIEFRVHEEPVFTGQTGQNSTNHPLTRCDDLTTSKTATGHTSTSNYITYSKVKSYIRESVVVSPRMEARSKSPKNVTNQAVMPPVRTFRTP